MATSPRTKPAVKSKGSAHNAGAEAAATPRSLKMESLALTYRPKLLSDLVGQSHIASEILGMLKQGRFPSTILLNGESGCGKCLTGNSIAPTSKGLLRLDELYEENINPVVAGTKEASFRVLGNDYKKHKASHVYATKGKTHKVELNHGIATEGLPEHRLWAFDRLSGQYVFVRLDALTRDDALPRHEATSLFGDATRISFDTSTCSQIEMQNWQAAGGKLPTVLTPGLARILGWIVSEGYNPPKGSDLNVEQHEAETHALIVADVQNEFNVVRHSHRTISLGSFGVLRKYLRSLTTPALSRDKEVPKTIRQAPKHLQREFLAALFEGDGSVWRANSHGTHRLEYVTVSDELARQVVCMLENFGIVCYNKQGLHYTGNGTRKRVNTVRVDKHSYELFQQQVGFLSARKSTKLNECVEHFTRQGNSKESLTGGPGNEIPCGNFVNVFYAEVSKHLLSSVETVTLCEGHRNEHRVTRAGSLARLRKDLGYSRAKTFDKNFGSDGWTTRYQAISVLDIAARAPKWLRRWMRSNPVVTNCLTVIEHTLSKHWVRVVSSRATRKVKKVYDITVPGVESYAVDAVIGHNTTTARMIARYVHCKSPDKETFAPCNECASCRYEEGHPDVHEINMAESRGIDDVRSLIQSSRSMPTVGENRIFIVDEIHAMTTQAAQAFLKPLEEPPSRTMWILCTTNPEKLPATILGRCHKLNVKRIEPQQLANRLSRISRREGVDMKEREGGIEILKLIADLSNGRMRDAISLLEKALFAISSGQEFDNKTLMSTFLATAESDLEKAAAHLLVALLSNNLKDMLKVVRITANPRGILNKLRWLLMYLLDNAIGNAKYAPYAAKLFTKLAQTAQLKVNLLQIVRLQYLLLEMESKFNSMSVDENVVMLAIFGNEISTSKS